MKPSDMTKTMTKAQARELAKRDRHYFARRLRGKWVVWDAISDHPVEFQD